MSAMVDPITLAVVQNYLVTTAKQMRDTIQRTAFSTVVYEDRDFACGLLDSDGGTMAEAPGLTAFMGTLSPGVRKCFEVIRKDDIEPNDIVASAMPEYTGSHPLDMMLFYPIFHDDRLFGFAASKAHLIDLGAKDFYPMDSTDAFQEGLRMPPVKLYERGKLNETVARIIKANSRAPESIWGDIHAQIASLRVGEAAIKRLLERYGFDTVRSCVQEIYDYSERMTRAAIADMPEGSWTVEDHMDDNGVERGIPVKIKLTISVDKKANELIVDFTGSAPQQKGPTNCPIIGTISYGRMIGKMVTTPEIPGNEGSFRPIKVIAPEGTIFNPTSGAPSMLYGWVGICAIEAALRLLAPLFPEKVPACSGGDLCGSMLYGVHPESGRFWNVVPLEGVGQGASALGDGESALIHISESCSRNLPIEMQEKNPVLVEKYELRQDSGGPGKFRGGLGVQRDVRLLAPGYLISGIERGTAPHWGVLGGKPGGKNYLYLKSRIHGEKEILKFPTIELAEGDLISVRAGGGGGYGDPFERDPEKVLQDVINGYVSIESARNDYGVVVDPGTLSLDVEATRRLRVRPR